MKCDRRRKRKSQSNSKTSSLHTSHHEAAKIPFIFAAAPQRVVNLCLTVFISNKFVNHFLRLSFLGPFCRFLLPPKDSHSLTRALFCSSSSFVAVPVLHRFNIFFDVSICAEGGFTPPHRRTAPIRFFYAVPYYSVKWNFSRLAYGAKQEKEKQNFIFILEHIKWILITFWKRWNKRRKEKIRLRFFERRGFVWTLRHRLRLFNYERNTFFPSI